MGKGLDSRLKELHEVTADEAKDYAETSKMLRLEDKKENLRGKMQDRKQRRDFAICLFAFVALYMCSVIVLVYMLAFGKGTLSDTVLVALLTTTTANVLGLFVIVAKYIFRAR